MIKVTGRATKKQKGGIIVVGGLNMDIVMVANDMPGAGEYVYGSKIQFIPGGNGLNCAVASSRLDGIVQLIGFVGEDSFGRDLLEFLNREDVDVTKVQTLKSTNTGTVVFLLINKAERHLVFPGGNMKANIGIMPELEAYPSDIVISQLTVPQEVIIHSFEEAKAIGAKTMLNLFPNYEVSKSLLNLSDYIILNEVELAFRTGDTEFIKAQHKDLHMTVEMVTERAKKLRTRKDQIIIVTLAERGAIGIVDDSLTIVEGIKVNFVDATGAGDCFLGAFATGLAEGMKFGEALEFANCAAAISVQTVGATTSYPSRNEVNSLLKKQKSAYE